MISRLCVCHLFYKLDARLWPSRTVQLSELPFRSFLSIATLACIAKREDSDGRAEARGSGAGHAQEGEEGDGGEGAAFFRTGNGEERERGMDSSRIGERDNVPHVLNYPFYSLLPRPPRPPSPPLSSRLLSLSRSALARNEHPRRVGAMSETLNKACPLQFRVSPPNERGNTPWRRRQSHKKQHCSIPRLEIALEGSSPSRQIARGIKIS